MENIGAGIERYVWSVHGQKSVRLQGMSLLFILKTGSAGLLKDKKRCKMVRDEKCVMCDSGAGKDVEHLMVMCVEFERDQWVLTDEVSKIVGTVVAGGI